MLSRTSPSGRGPSPLLAVAAVCALGLLSACGGAAPASGDSSSTITVLRSGGSTFEPLYIADQQGFFKQQGLNVVIKTGAQDTSQNAPSVINGEAQFAMTDSSGFLKGAAAGLPIQIVSGMQSSTTATPPSDGLLVGSGSGISSFKDVGGKTIGLAALGGTLQFICEYSAKQAGADPSTIKFVSLPLASTVDSVTKGQVDAAYTFATYYDAGKAAGLTAIGNGTNDLPGLPQALLFASSSWLAQNGDAAKKFTAAVAEAIDYANKNPDAVRAVDTKYTQLPAAYIKNRTIQVFSAPIDTGALKTVIDDQQAFGLIKTAPDESKIMWSGAPTTTGSK